MTKRKELEKIIQEMNSLQKMRDESYEKGFDLNVRRNELGLEILKEEKLLNGTLWDVFYWDGNGKYF